MILKQKLTLTILAMVALLPVAGRAQTARNVLFVGNSYTEVNNLPQMVDRIATSMGDTLTWQSNTPGGCTFQQHCSNQSMTLIRGGGWDAVVLQEQSQYPSFPQQQVESEVFPYAQRLVDSVYAHNPCCEPMFYMTWGRKYGDAGNAPYFPVLGTYEGMDSMLCLRYTYMAHQYDAALCPVGRVWRYLREHHHDIELYQSDNSHPSVAGTYAAACAFYVMLFHRDPELIDYSASLPEATAATIRTTVHTVVYAALQQWQRPLPQAVMAIDSIDGRSVTLSSTSLQADNLEWHFGDGTVATAAAQQATVEHLYADSGRYNVTLVALRHCMADSISLTLHVAAAADSSVGIGENDTEVQNSRARLTIRPNPARGQVTLDVAAREPVEVTIHDMGGRPVWHQRLEGSSQTTLDVWRWPAGEYLLTTGSRPQRLVIVH